MWKLFGCWSAGLFVKGIGLGSLKDGLFRAEENDGIFWICGFYDIFDETLFDDYFDVFKINEGYFCTYYLFTIIN